MKLHVLPNNYTNPAPRPGPAATGHRQVATRPGELLPPWRVQPRLLHRRLPHLAADRRVDQTQTRTPPVLARSPAPVLRHRLAVRPQRGRLPRRIQRRDHPLPLPRRADPDPWTITVPATVNQ